MSNYYLDLCDDLDCNCPRCRADNEIDESTIEDYFDEDTQILLAEQDAQEKARFFGYEPACY